MFCLICNKHVYETIDFRSLFQMNYKIHKRCEVFLELESSLEVIPITNNVVYFEYLLPYRVNLNEDNLFLFNVLRVLNKYQNKENWSVIYIYEEEEYNTLNDETKYLFLQMGQKPLVFISLYPY